VGIVDDVKEHPLFAIIYVAMSLFFIGALVVSALTYSHVVRGNLLITLDDPQEDVQVLENGSLVLSFSIDVVNPSRYDLRTSSLYWSVRISNGTPYHPSYIPLGVSYKGPTEEITIEAGDTCTLAYSVTVSDRALLSRVYGFINYSSSIGNEYSVMTVPYENEIRLYAGMDDFKHDYVREGYLNDLVEVELYYVDED